MAPDPLPPTANSVTTPAVVMRPMRRPLVSVYQRLPSAPATIERGLLPGVMPAENSVTTPAGVMRPIRPASYSANQRLPSGPAVMPSGPLPSLTPRGTP